jgi:dTDP-glucose 4,6-dehydratase
MLSSCRFAAASAASTRPDSIFDSAGRAFQLLEQLRPAPVRREAYPLTILKCLAAEPIPVYGRGANIRDWLFVEDHADALTLVLEKGRVGQTYNIGGEAERRNIDVVHAMCDVMERLAPRNSGQTYRAVVTFVPDRPGHDFRYAIDCAKMKAELG